MVPLATSPRVLLHGEQSKGPTASSRATPAGGLGTLYCISLIGEGPCHINRWNCRLFGPLLPASASCSKLTNIPLEAPARNSGVTRSSPRAAPPPGQMTAFMGCCSWLGERPALRREIPASEMTQRPGQNSSGNGLEQTISVPNMDRSQNNHGDWKKAGKREGRGWG